MSGTYFNGTPGVYAGPQITPRSFFSQYNSMLRMVPSLIEIDGANSRDTGNVPPDTIRAGVMLGIETSSRLLRPTIIGVTAAASLAGATSITVNAAVATEVARLITNAAGNVSLTLQGPPTTAGVISTTTVSASAASGTTITVGTTNVNEVQLMAITGTLSAGTYSIVFNGIATGPIAYNASVTNINTALTAAFGASQIVASGTAQTATVLTFSGSNYAGLPQPLATVDISGLTGATEGTITRTTPGSGALPALVSGSLIRPADGSQSFLTFQLSEFGICVVAQAGGSINQPLGQFVTGADLITANVVNFLADDFGNTIDVSCTAQLQSEMRAQGFYTFDENRQ